MKSKKIRWNCQGNSAIDPPAKTMENMLRQVPPHLPIALDLPKPMRPSSPDHKCNLVVGKSGLEGQGVFKVGVRYGNLKIMVLNMAGFRYHVVVHNCRLSLL